MTSVKLINHSSSTADWNEKQFLAFPTEIMKQMIKSISVDPICDDLEYNMIKTSIMSVFPYTRCIKHGLYKSKPRIIIE